MWPVQGKVGWTGQFGNSGHGWSVFGLECDLTFSRVVGLVDDVPDLFTSATPERDDETWLSLDLGERGTSITLTQESAWRAYRELGKVLESLLGK